MSWSFSCCWNLWASLLTCRRLTLTSPPVNSALTFPDDKDKQPSALGQLLWEWTGQYMSLSWVSTICTVWGWEIRFDVTWTLWEQDRPFLHTLSPKLLSFTAFVAVWGISLFVLTCVYFSSVCFCLPLRCAASLSYAGMSSHSSSLCLFWIWSFPVQYFNCKQSI